MGWWENSIRTWSGPRLPILIMQVVISLGMIVTNSIGLATRGFDPWRVAFVLGFGLLLVMWTVTLVGALRRRAQDRRDDESGAARPADEVG